MFLLSDKYVVCEVALVFALTRFILSFLLNLLINSPASPSSSSSCCSSSSSSSSSPNSRKITKNLSLTTFGNIHQEDHAIATISCAVCLSRLRKKSQVWELRNCSHVFHKHCLERWMESHDTCPLCRASLAAADESFLPEPPSWAVERMLYLFGDDLLP